MLDILLRDALFDRRSLRRYHADVPSEEVISALLSAAVWAPSAHNRQPWRFAVVRQASHKIALANAMGARLRSDLMRDALPPEAIEADASRSYARLTEAPVLIVVCLTMADMDGYSDPVRSGHEHSMAVQSVAMAGQNLLLAAHGYGLGACWMCAPLFCPDIVRDALNLPQQWEPQGLITLGYPAQVREKDRKPLKEVVTWL